MSLQGSAPRDGRPARRHPRRGTAAATRHAPRGGRAAGVPRSPRPAGAPPFARKRERGRARIALAEGHAATRRRAARALRGAGFEPRAVRDMASLRALLEREPPAALVLGSLPGRRTPAALLKAVREAAPGTAVILLLPPGRRPPGDAGGAGVPYLRSPLEARQLVNAVSALLEGQQVQRDFQQAVAEIAEHSGERELLLGASAAFCSTIALPDLLVQLAQRLVRAVHVTLCQVLLLDPRNDHLVVEASFPIRAVPHALQAGTRVPVKEFECYRRALAGHVVLLQHGAPDFGLPARDREVVLGPFSSGLLMPMVTTRGVLGVLTLLEARSWDRSPFSSRKIHLCQALCSQAAIALQNSLLFAERERSHLATLAALVAALDARERETRAHSWRVRAYTLRLAEVVGAPGEGREALAAGALLHDIGKIGVPDQILLKPGPLSPEEWVEMRKHPAIGAEILRDLDHLRGACEIVLAHQERYDGTGYPLGIAGHAIPFGARIFAVADALDAMTSDRPYHRAIAFPAARDDIVRHSGTQFDPEVVRAFLAVPLDEWQGIRAIFPDGLPPRPGHPDLPPEASSLFPPEPPGLLPSTVVRLPSASAGLVG